MKKCFKNISVNYKMTDYLKENYEKHPAFSFSDAPYNIDLSKIYSFDKNYQRIINGALKKHAQFKIEKIKLAAQLEEIFRELKLQSNDDYESLFLNELESESLRLLYEEIDYYQSTVKTNHIISRKDTRFMSLKSDRYYFGKLTDNAILQIINLSEAEIDQLRGRVSEGEFTRENLSINNGVIVNQIVRTLNKDFCAQGVLKSVSAYMNANYHVTGLALELSVPQATWWQDTLNKVAQPKTVYAHLDQSVKFPKAIVYLSNVKKVNGPTSCYPSIYEQLHLNALQEIIGRVIHIVGSQEGSCLQDYYGSSYHQAMSSERFRKHFMRLPTELRFHSHMGWDIVHDSKIEKKFLEHEKVMTGNVGTFIVFDGSRLFHRGGLIESGERIVLQVIFGPKPGYDERIKSLFRRIISKIWGIIT